MPRITAKQFLDAFRKEWFRAVEEDRVNVAESYCAGSTWTGFMLDGDDSLLRRVAESLSMTMEREWYRWDCIYHAGNDPMIPYGTFTACIDAAIEHEGNPGSAEQEMYKMRMLLCSPLKVLITYDTFPAREPNGMSDKLAELLDIGIRADTEWPEAEGTEYLFLVGKQEQGDDLPHWRHMVAGSGRFRDCKPPSDCLRPL
ncbi:MAG: hypothetical protein OXS40_01570 [Gammaproteobacteria bacterium]|nr:hypothetical protein [Gammaproteobacteria bacterium]